VSVLFADLVGFTTLSEGRDAEETRELLSRYFELAGVVIGRYGGTIEKFIGDAVMAVWGAPVARENDAERAVRAALELVQAVRTLGPGLHARAGVLTGEAAVTIGATNQGMVAGDIVNTASRLQSVAQPGTVLVGESTERAANQAIAFEPAGDQVLKGKQAPVPAFRAIRVVAERGGRNRADQLEAPLVGRDTELGLLKDLVHATGRERRTRIVSVVGAAGAGKSRLIRELSQYLDGLVETVYWHTGRSPAYGEGITFWALGEMVRGRAGLAETDDEATTRAKVVAAVDRWVPDESERGWIVDAVLVLLGLDTNATIAREELFSAWRTLFERIAAQGTAVLVFEDLHWADPGTLDFIDHLAEWSRGVPILVITVARPELFEHRPSWGAGRRNFVALGLEPLTETSIHELLRALVPGLPEASLRSIAERADGIPLYAVETIRMLVAEGRLVATEDGYTPAGDLTTVAVPETLHALIAARLDALPPPERSLIQDAAVLGQSFTPDALAAVSGLEGSQVEELTRSLVRRELFTQDLDPRSSERGQFAFVQALIREVAYGTLGRRDRRSRHLAAARHFEAMGEDELAGALASHYLAAYRSGRDDPDSGPLATQAKIALRAAAGRASALGSHDQATTFLLEAVEVTEDPAEIADLLERAGEASIVSGQVERAAPLLRDAIERRQQLGDRSGAARATALLGQGAVNAWRSKEAVEILEPAIATYADLVDDPALAAIEHQLARAYWFGDRNDEAIELADRAIGRAERIEATELIADALITKGSVLGFESRPYEGSGILEAGIRLAESLGLRATVVRGLLNLGVAYIGRDPRMALDRSRAAHDLAARYGFRGTYTTALGNACEVAVQLGEWDWALEATSRVSSEHLELGDRASLLRPPEEILSMRGESVDALLAEHEELVRETADSQQVSNLAAGRAVAAFVAGRYDEAAEGFRRSAQLNPTNGATDLPRMVRAVLWSGDLDALREAVSELDHAQLHGRQVEVSRRTVHAALAALDGDAEAAAQAYATVLPELAELGLVLEQALVVIDMAQVLGADAPIVRSSIDEARAILGRLGAGPFLARLEAVAGVPPAARPRAVPSPESVSPSG
jgi:class 3 adenylate cyclase/tetratricopeptide (TPR) repeat protein